MVIIAILAAITIVSYNGITSRAQNATQLTTVENLQKSLLSGVIQGYSIVDEAKPICLGNSSDYPAGGGFSAGECAKIQIDASTTSITYNAADFSSWTTPMPSAKMASKSATTSISGSTYTYTGRGAWLSYPYIYSGGGAANLNWVPQVAGQCGSGASVVNAICQMALTF